MKEEHLASLTRVHNDCARMIYGVTRWHHQHENLTLTEVLGALLHYYSTHLARPSTSVLSSSLLKSRNSQMTASRTVSLSLVKASCGKRNTHTKGRYFKILSDDHFIDPSKGVNHKLGSTDVWRKDLVAWNNGGSKLPNWKASATPSTSFYDLDLTSPPAQAFTLNPNAPTVWFPSLRPIFTLFPSIETPFLNNFWSFLSPFAAQFFL